MSAHRDPPYLVPGVQIAERLPGEPAGRPPPTPIFVALMVMRVALLGLKAMIALPLVVPYLFGVAIAGRPPNTVRLGQVFHFLGLVWWTAPPSLSRLARVWLTLRIARRAVSIPIAGLAWLLDELLYGRALKAVRIEAPVIKISAARSGSTQLGHYIEADPGVIAPTVLQILFPYLWLWRLVTPIARRFVTRAQVRALIERRVPPEFIERHEGDPFRTDTFEAGLYVHHLNHLAPFLGAEAIERDFGMGVVHATTRTLWTEVFADYFDGVARKTLLFAGPEAAGRRYFVKGHFLAAADTLAARYPDARFLTMLRPPARRLQSMINFLWCNPIDPTLGKPEWPPLVQGLTRLELDYNRAEHDWFTRADGPRRCVLRFDDYVRDLEGTMAEVYRACFDLDELPPHVPREHAPRERKNYSVNRSLAQLGVDGAAYEAAQPEFVAWCRGAAAEGDRAG